MNLASHPKIGTAGRDRKRSITAAPLHSGSCGSYWLVAGDGREGRGPLVLRLDDGLRVLPVFGFEEEARLFSRRAGRNVRRIEPCRLVSLLRGPLREVELLALDPLSDAPADLLDGAASLTRQRFLGSLLGAGSTVGRDIVDGPRGAPDQGSP